MGPTRTGMQFVEASLNRRAQRLANQSTGPDSDSALLEEILWELRQGNKMRWACMDEEQRQAFSLLP